MTSATEARELVERLRLEVEYDNDRPDGPREITYGKVFADAADFIEKHAASLTAAPPSGEVVIKALEWIEFQGGSRADALSILGEFVAFGDGSWSDPYNFHAAVPPFGTLDAAKAAARADYEARIRSALDTAHAAPAPGGEEERKNPLDGNGVAAAVAAYAERLPFGMRDGARGAEALKDAISDAISAYLASHTAVEPVADALRAFRLTGSLELGIAIDNTLAAITAQAAALAKAERERDEALGKLALLIDRVVYTDSYGVAGSEFFCCHLCNGGGSPNAPFEHEAHCLVLALEDIAESWFEHHRERDKCLDEETVARKAAESDAATLKARIAELEAVLGSILRGEYESAIYGLLDCIDNDGMHYQSQFLADQIAKAEQLLSRRLTEAPSHD